MKKVFIFKEAEKIVLYICAGVVALFALATIGSYILHPELGLGHFLEGLFGITLGAFIIFIIFKALSLTDIVGTRAILTDDEFIYRRKHIPLDKIRHLRIVVKEQEFVTGLCLKIVYEKDGKEDEVLIGIAHSLFFFLHSDFPPKFVKELIRLRGEKGVSQEVFEFIETGTVKRWEEYFKRAREKYGLVWIWVLFIVFTLLSFTKTSEVARQVFDFLAILCVIGGFAVLIQKTIKNKRKQRR